MLKSPFYLGVALLALISGGCGRKAKPPIFVASTGHDCDMKVRELGLYCPECKKLLSPDELASDGDCKQCDEKPIQVEVCVKGGVDKARIMFRCAGCNAAGDARDEIVHASTCQKKEIREFCSKSGTMPHLGDSGGAR